MKTLLILFFSASAWAAETGTPVADIPTAPAAKKSHSEAVEELVAKRGHARSDIERMNEKKVCDGDGDCEVLEAGWRHCGGPNEYIIVSERSKDYKTIKAKIAELTRLERDIANAEPPDDCTPVPKLPEARCIAEKCAAKGSPGGTK